MLKVQCIAVQQHCIRLTGKEFTMSLLDFASENLKKREKQDRIDTAQAVIDQAASKKDGWTLLEIAQFVLADEFKDILGELQWRPGHAPKKRLTAEQKNDIHRTVYARVQQRTEAGDAVTISDMHPEFESTYDISRVTFSQILNSMIKAGFLKSAKEGRDYKFTVGAKQPS